MVNTEDVWLCDTLDESADGALPNGTRCRFWLRLCDDGKWVPQAKRPAFPIAVFNTPDKNMSRWLVPGCEQLKSHLSNIGQRTMEKRGPRSRSQTRSSACEELLEVLEKR
ncbi:hypothetical protein AC578_5188 [Pseudocercospora eumusae]|uniref:Uncharacterized protein n=1 Tax=Pseudocercospora eumusae TaxID=321146 RepID=A0A139HMQ2_9PEZI|nr:hypothetical protein AC578_5188 [Pseudocercospora eumusae]